MARSLTPRPRTSIALFVAVALGIASCAGTDAEQSDSGAASVPASSPDQVSTAPPPIEPGGDEDLESDDSANLETAAEQIAAIRQAPDGDPLDVALAEYSALFGPLPGTAAIPQDGSIPTSATHILETLESRRADLTAEQAAALDEQLARFDSIEPVAAFLLNDPTEADTTDAPDTTEPSPEGLARPMGFSAARGARPAPDAIQNEIRLVAAQVQAALGGRPILAWVEIVPNGSLDGATALNRSLGTLNPKRASLFADGIVADCVIKLTESIVAGDALDTTSDAQPAVIHEVLHCWQFGQLDLDAVRQNAMDDWAKEGMAAYFGDLLGGLNRFNAEWWSGYVLTQVEADGTWPLYPSSYAAIGFWSRVAERSDLVGAMKRTLAASPDNDAMYTAAIAEMAHGPAWLAAGTAQQAAWGPGWTASGPGIPSGPRRPAQVAVAFTDGPVTESVRPAAHRNVQFDLEPIPAAPGTVLKLALDGSAVARVGDNDVVVNGDFALTDWCLGDCTCPDDRPAFPAERVLSEPYNVTASLVGLAGSGSSALAELVVFNADEYDCENPDLGEPNGALLGVWRASPESVARMFALASAFGADAEAIDVEITSGEVLMTFAEDGTGSLAYNNVGIFMNDAVIGQMTVDGSGTFSWGTVDGQILIADTTFALSMSAPALGPEPLTITSDDVPQAGVTRLAVSIAGPTLIVNESEGSAGEVFFPMVWVRRGDS